MRNRIVIEADNVGGNYWKDIWTFRGLFAFLAWRDLLVRYKQTLIGIAWAIIRPVITIVVFSFFRTLIDQSLDTAQVVLETAVAMIPWTLFASSITESSNSLIANSNLITKVYFPRMIIPLSTIIVSVVDFIISFLILIALMIYFGQGVTSTIWFLPLLFLQTIVASVGLGLYLAAVNVKYRDFRYVVPFLLQLGLFLSPIGFSSTIIFDPQVPLWIQYCYSLNPMIVVIDGFRWCILGIQSPMTASAIIISVSFSVLMLVLGVWYFRRTEKKFADII